MESVDEKVNLNDIMDISEDEFKKQITAWIDERGISRKLQSKLRADLFEQFNRTKLGRQMTEQHQQSHRIVLSPLILVLNTLVAEFLYSEDCHFTLSVFTNEVPYKNTLPNFDATLPREFQFSATELNDIFEAIGISDQNEQSVREFYANHASKEVLNKSLLYCIIKTLVSQIDSGRSEKLNKKIKSKIKVKSVKASKSSVTNVSSSSQQSGNPSPPSDQIRTNREPTHAKNDQFHMSSRYFKYLNRYLDILSDRINDMSQLLAEKRTNRKSHRPAADSSSQEESLKKDLRKVIENINELTKSQRKSKRFQDVLNSIERLSMSVEKCGGKLEDLLKAVDIQSKNRETAEKNVNESKVDRFVGMDYASWLKELKTSEHGRKFIDRLEVSLQKTMEKERENLDKLYEEKTNNYRMLIRLHYKQKYDTNKGEPSSVERPEKDVSSPVGKITPDITEKLLAESLATRAIEQEQQVDQIVQTAKIRLQQLERESEDLDQTFQSYLRRQQISKQQMSNDASKIWENYSLSKAALAHYDIIEEKSPIVQSNPSKMAETMKMSSIFNSTFKEDVDIEEVLKDLHEIKHLKSPRFDKEEVFSKEKLLPRKTQKVISRPPVFDYRDRMFDAQTKTALLEIQRNTTSAKPKDSDKQTFKIPGVANVPTKKMNGINGFSYDKIVIQSPKKIDLTTNGGMVDEQVIIANQTTNGKFNGAAKIQDATKPRVTFEKEKIETIQKVVEIESIPEMKNGNKTNQPDNIEPMQKTRDLEAIQSATDIHSNGNEKNIESNMKATTENKDAVNVAIDSKTMKSNNSDKAKLPTFDDINIEEEIKELERSMKLPEQPKNNGSTEPIEPTIVSNQTNGIDEVNIKIGSNEPPKIITNGATNNITFVSDTDSVELDSDQISIGVQRFVKSPDDDFWI